MVASACIPQVSACMLALTNIDTNGVPTPGAGNRYVSDALVSLAWSWEYEEPAEIKGENGCGETKVSYKPPPTRKRGLITITLITPDPYLSQMLSQGTVLTDGEAVGFASPRLGQISEEAVGIEVWAKRIKDGKLDPNYPYAWWLYPWVQNLRDGDHEHNNAILNTVFTGDALENENWFDGPLNDWPSTSDSPYQWIPTVSMPVAQCGVQAVNAS